MLFNKWRSSDLFLVLTLFAATVAVYIWGVNGPFLFDDKYNIVNNPFVHDLKYFFQYFTNPLTHNVLPQNAPYRPLCTTVYAILWWLGHGSTLPFHVYKIILHALAAILSFKIYQNLLSKSGASESDSKPLITAAFVGALIFAIHPANAETVNYISSTSSLQCAVLYLAAFYSFLRGRLILMALLFFAAMLTKEEGVTLPFVLILYHWIFQKRPIDRRAIAVAFVSMLIFLGIYLSMPKTVQFSNIDSATYLFTQFRAWIKYALWIVMPWGFSIEHMGFGFSKTLTEPSVFLALLVNLTVIGTTLYFATKKLGQLSTETRCFIFGLLSYYVVMAPASSIFALSEPINEHRYYLSYSFFLPALLIFVSSWKWLGSSRLRVGLSVGIVVLLTVLTLRQVSIWKTAVGVWQNTVVNDPENSRAYLNLGVEQLAMARYDEAIDNFNSCARLNPAYPYCSLNLGIAYQAKGDDQQAEKYYQMAYGLDRGLLLTLSHYGNFLITRKKEYQEGLDLLKKCEEIAQGSFDGCLTSKSLALRSLGKMDEALAAAQLMLQKMPYSRDVQFEWGLTLIAAQKFDEAYAFFQTILDKNSKDTQAIHNLAWIEMQRKNWDHARELWNEKLRIVPNDPLSLLHLKLIDQNLEKQNRRPQRKSKK